ncbi:MAG: DUF3307 domain-containing protein [bacterium]|nr:DUF3307 domain-containing protein [bacterium]
MQWFNDLKVSTPMNKDLVQFTFEQGNILILILLAHVLADFVFETNKMVEEKKSGSVNKCGII